MLLGDIRHYLKQRGSASLDDIALHFDLSHDAAQFAMAYWQRRGKVSEISQGTACGSSGCDGCGSHSNAQVLYGWVTRDIPLQWRPRTV